MFLNFNYCKSAELLKKLISTLTTNSGIASVPCAWEQEIFLRPRQ